MSTNERASFPLPYFGSRNFLGPHVSVSFFSAHLGQAAFSLGVPNPACLPDMSQPPQGLCRGGMA